MEKHFTLSRSISGPDSTFSLEPHEFKEMVAAIRIVEKATGKVNYDVTDQEAASRVFRRSLFVIRDMHEGEVFTKENVGSIRPGYGLHTQHLGEIIGRCTTKKINRGTPMTWVVQ